MFNLKLVLFVKIVEIYVNLARGDRTDTFAKAISSDGRSFREEVCLYLAWNIFQQCILLHFD